MTHPFRLTPIDQVKPNPRNPRTHSKKQIRQIAGSIRDLGYAAPILIDENGVLIAGHGRLEAAKLLGMSSIPAMVIRGLTAAKKRALLLADNRIAQSAGWDREQLAIELATLPELLEEGVCGELVSTANSLISRENTGNFIDFGSISEILRHVTK